MQHDVFRVRPCHNTNPNPIPFHGCMIFHCTNTPKFIYPVIGWWTSVVFPPFGHCESRDYKHSSASYYVDMFSVLLSIHPGMELLNHMVTLHCTFWWNTSWGDRLGLVRLLTLWCDAEHLLGFLGSTSLWLFPGVMEEHLETEMLLKMYCKGWRHISWS